VPSDDAAAPLIEPGNVRFSGPTPLHRGDHADGTDDNCGGRDEDKMTAGARAAAGASAGEDHWDESERDHLRALTH
jgi:hypothetical protein